MRHETTAIIILSLLAAGLFLFGAHNTVRSQRQLSEREADNRALSDRLQAALDENAAMRAFHTGGVNDRIITCIRLYGEPHADARTKQKKPAGKVLWFHGGPYTFLRNPGEPGETRQDAVIGVSLWDAPEGDPANARALLSGIHPGIALVIGQRIETYGLKLKEKIWEYQDVTGTNPAESKELLDLIMKEIEFIQNGHVQ